MEWLNIIETFSNAVENDSNINLAYASDTESVANNNGGNSNKSDNSNVDKFSFDRSSADAWANESNNTGIMPNVNMPGRVYNESFGGQNQYQGKAGTGGVDNRRLNYELEKESLKSAKEQNLTSDMVSGAQDLNSFMDKGGFRKDGVDNNNDGKDDFNLEGTLGLAGAAANIAGSFVDDNPYGTGNSSNDGTIDAAVGAIPYASSINEIADFGSELIESNINYDEYGRIDNEGDANLAVASAVINPLNTYTAYSDNMDRTGQDAWDSENIWGTLLGAALPGFMGADNVNLQNEIGDYEEGADKQRDALNSRYEESQNNINRSKQRYQNAMMEANRIYGNNGQMRVALHGGILSSNVFYIVVKKEEERKRNKKVDYIPYKIDRTNIKALKGGGSVIPFGVLHNQKNNIGDRGLPLVYKGYKVMEIETDELVLHDKPTTRIKALRKEYNKTKDRKILIEIGSIMSEEIKNNTFSYTKEFECLNNNTCKI